jgi:DNA-binding response OmpR family regulator
MKPSSLAVLDAPEAARRTPCVLLAEDDLAFRLLLWSAFRSWGFSVIEASNGLELAALLESQLLDPPHAATVDLVVSDIRMPGRSGLLALAELRERDWSTPVVLMSAFGDAAAHAEALRLGATLLDKPFPLRALHDLVGALR